MKTTPAHHLIAAALIGVTAFTATIACAANPLPAWNEGEAVFIWRSLKG